MRVKYPLIVIRIQKRELFTAAEALCGIARVVDPRWERVKVPSSLFPAMIVLADINDVCPGGMNPARPAPFTSSKGGRTFAEKVTFQENVSARTSVIRLETKTSASEARSTRAA